MSRKLKVKDYNKDQIIRTEYLEEIINFNKHISQRDIDEAVGVERGKREVADAQWRRRIERLEEKERQPAMFERFV
jgi:hypothetical protein